MNLRRYIICNSVVAALAILAIGSALEPTDNDSDAVKQMHVPMVAHEVTHATPVPTARIEAQVDDWQYISDINDVLIEAGWPVDLLQEASDVAWCESRHNASATNGVFLGLFQIGPDWWPYYGYDDSRYADPVYNASLALQVYYYDIERGQAAWTQWQCKP